MPTSLNTKEIAHFAQDSAAWWDESGPFRPLHRLNPLRMRYIRDRLCAHFGREGLTPFKGLRVLDIGCGGGLVCEPLARLGADVTGIDADEQAIEVATAHAAVSGLEIRYQNCLAEDLLQSSSPRRRGSGEPAKSDLVRTLPDRRLRGDDMNGWDVILALEIVEHVEDRDFFVETCAALCEPGGLVIFSTLNRTAKSYALGIVAAEQILRWVPRGTHDWKKFVRPSELAGSGRQAGLRESDIIGYRFDMQAREFAFTSDVAVNYFLTLEKPE